MSTTPSVSSHQRHLASRSGRCGHAHAHSVIGVRSCRAECMPIFSQSVCHFSSAFRFTLCRVFLYVSRNPSGQVKTFRDCALQRIKSTLCWAHSRRCVKFVPALTQRLASIPARSGSLPCGGTSTQHSPCRGTTVCTSPLGDGASSSS